MRLFYDVGSRFNHFLVSGSAASAAISSTTVTVPPPSMLRGKTLEEIVNRWTTELEIHVREFGRFAGEVAVWDRALIENGNNVSCIFELSRIRH